MSSQSYAILFWSSLVGLTIALFLILRTRWAQAQPLSKCVALSVFSHIVFAGFAYGTRIFVDPPIVEAEPVIHLALIADLRGDDPLPPETELQPGIPLKPLEPVPSVAMVDSDEMVEGDVPSEQEDNDSNELDDAAQLAEATEDSEDEPPAETVETEIAATDAPEPEEITAFKATPEETAEPESAPADDQLVSSSEDVSEETPAEPEVENTEAAEQLADVLEDASAEPPAESLATAQADPSSEDVSTAENLPDDDTLASAEDAEPAERLVSTEASERYVNQTAPVATALRGPPRRPADGAELPRAYQSRVAPDRPLLVERYGGNARTEAAVAAALDWLVKHQSADGRWRAADFGAGEERNVLGHHRHGAGREGDTGITGLALLALLAAGHTHYEGEYRASVQHGLEFLLSAQRADGSLAGNAELFAAMYCHGIALLAVSEAYAMTGDERLRGAVAAGQQFTLATQIRADGGWRYQSGDQQGDTSQLGWQLMALRSAELAGLPIPPDSRRGMMRFLDSVAAGRSGGLASYRAGTRPSPTMTAEALACWIFLERPPRPEAIDEAARYLTQNLPNDREVNLYYWYYGTLALFHLQAAAGQQWNGAMQEQLLRLQVRSGEHAGSWDPSTVWGGYGGRVYSTAMGALCLEVYYRYLPLYGTRTLADRPARKGY